MPEALVFQPGYHLAPIPRGELGELSKVIEEALEALDAQNQGARLMVLVELSDLVGAMRALCQRHGISLPSAPLPHEDLFCVRPILDALERLSASPHPVSSQSGRQGLAQVKGLVCDYLRTNHPSLTWADMEAMAVITARAFESGRRS